MQSIRVRIIVLSSIIILATLIVLSDSIYETSAIIIQFAERIIFQHPIFGVVLFILLALLSSMLAFYSSAILVPIGIQTWGYANCFVFLWLGWLLGGIFSYCIGRYLGRSVVSRILGERRVVHFESQIHQNITFWHILLFQAALPSEIPGYILGTLQYRFRLYIAALAITELPYAIGTVYLGQSFLNRSELSIIIIGSGAIFVGTYLYSLYKQNFHLSAKT